MRTETVSTLRGSHIMDAVALCDYIVSLQWPIKEDQLIEARCRARGIRIALRAHSGLDDVRVPVRAEGGK